MPSASALTSSHEPDCCSHDAQINDGVVNHRAAGRVSILGQSPDRQEVAGVHARTNSIVGRFSVTSFHLIGSCF